MAAPARSPRITHCSWGRIEVEGRSGPYKDAKLYPGGSREWNWRETGTRHEPGVQPGDVEELIERGARVLILGKGIHGRLRVSPKTLALLIEEGIPFHVLETGDAVRLYNEIQETEPVGALLHTTC